MYEMHVGTRPARRVVLLLIVAGALAISVGLAWTQVRAARALAEPVALEGTPLVVRPPAGWVASPREPGTFVKAIRKRVWGRDVWTADRKVTFSYNDYFHQLQKLFEAMAVSPAAPGSIAGWDGVQFIVTEPGKRWVQQSVFRWASTPWGGQLAVTYVPLGEATAGDLDLLDVICAAIAINGSNLYVGAEQTLSWVGLRVPTPEEWKILGPQFVDGPGMCIQDAGKTPPRWALAVFRRWLRPGQPPANLLANEAAQVLGRFVVPVRRRAENGAYVAYVRNPQAIGGHSAIVSLWEVARQSDEVAVIYALADPQHASLADAAAAVLAEGLRFETPYPR